MEMIERSANVLDDLSPEEMDEFVGSDNPSPMRRYPAASDEIKLSVEEVRQALAAIPDDLSPEDAKEERIRRLGEALLVKREMALVRSLVGIAMPDPTTEQREAMQAALGHMYRLGGMKLLTHTAVPMYAPVVKAAAAADARKSLSTLRTPRYRDARKTRSRPACSALDGPDFHSSFPIAPRIRLSDKTSRFRVQRHLRLPDIYWS
jgi:hypothetical protein